ncbi:GmrSD restriction endonuclease domain-containing protein [Glycocaulis sp.]|uniref:GmrSD restriction endonuclease domain-containing protein n=1 Tax=Glycocaulis sp. TaxID=1969725 RepID=UPI003D19A5E9
MHCTTQPWNIGKLRLEQNRIDLSPPYQREAGIWSDEKKQLFLDSIFNGFDVPKLYFHNKSIEKGPYRFAVVDGKQRLSAVLGYLSDEFALASDFKFSGDPEFFGGDGPPIGGRRFSELSENQKEFLRSQTIDVVEVSDADEDDIEELFSRLNNGEPLNAAEKRNAMGGAMIYLVRDIAKNDKLNAMLSFKDKRMSYHEVAAKIIRLEQTDQQGAGYYCDLKKKFLDQMVDKGRSLSTGEIDGLRTRVEKNIKVLSRIFSSNDPLLSKQSYPQLYYAWVKIIMSDYGHDEIHKKIRGFLEKFHADRIRNLELAEDDRDPRLVEYGRLMQQGTNDVESMRDRARILTRYFLEQNPDVAIKDKTRSFSDDERYVIWIRSGRQCSNAHCQRPLPDIDEMHADHVIPWSSGGATNLENAQALCVNCNLEKGKKSLAR